MEVTIDLERYARLVKMEYVANVLMRDITERAKEYRGYSHQEVQMLRDMFGERYRTHEEEMEETNNA